MLSTMSFRSWILVAVAVLLSSRGADAHVKLPTLISEGMVLEQKVPVHIWGSADEGEKVTVALRGQSVSAVARGGQWSLLLKPLDAGGPFAMTVTSQDSHGAAQDRIVVEQVFVGEVWVCSGQSNMEFPLSRAFEARSEIEAAADPGLRMFTVGRQLADTPKAEVSSGRWEAASPETRAHFSAVAYYFGRALRAARHVPIGLIHSSWGGTPAEAWTKRSVLESWGAPASAFAGLAPPNAAAQAGYERALAAWVAAGRPQGNFADPGILDSAKPWALPQTETRDWRSMSLPGAWENVGPDLQIDGGVWFRRDVTIPKAWEGRALDLHLGPIDDLDTTYFNGAVVGATGDEVPNHWQVLRRYQIPASSVHAGRGVLAVRVWDQGGEGGFMGPASELWLAPAGAPENERATLAGDWHFKPERTRPTQPNPPGLNQNLPSVLFNGMIAPLLPYTIAGATWYQGESNAGRAGQYRSLLTAMIRNWRADWQLGDFPFLIVQLAPYLAITEQPEESGWAALREAQAQVSHDVPRVGLAVITDVGDEKDIHPTHKQPVGERLALAARSIAYGEHIIASGPSFRSAAIEKGKIAISFDNVGKGLALRGQALRGFAIAGSDRKFVNAEARIDGSRVIVSSPRIPAPAYVRFGWANYPVVNLWNADGLPAVPFRTDGQ